MALHFFPTSFTVPNGSGGTVSTSGNAGFMPVAAINYANSRGTRCGIALGFDDGTNRVGTHCAVGNSYFTDGLNYSNHAWSAQHSLVTCRNADFSNSALAARVNAFTSTGAEYIINQNDGGANGWDAGIVPRVALLGGPGISAKVGQFSTVSGVASVTTPARPVILFFILNAGGGYQLIGGDQNRPSLGIAADCGATVACVGNNSSDTVSATSVSRRAQTTTKCFTIVGPTSILGSATVVISDTGFTFTQTVGGSIGFGYLALMGPLSANLVTFTQPLATGTQTVPLTMTSPRGFLVMSDCHSNIDGTIQNDLNFMFGAGSTSGQSSIWGGVKTATGAPPWTRELHPLSVNSQIIHWEDPTGPDAGTVKGQASLTSLGIGAATLNWTLVDGVSQPKFIGIALGDGGVGPQAVCGDFPSVSASQGPCDIITPLYWAAIQPSPLNASPPEAVFQGAQTPLLDPVTYYGGFKPARVLRISPIIREASDYMTGSFPAQSASVVWADHPRYIRTVFGTQRADYTSSPIWIYLISNEDRIVFGTPRLLFYGFIAEDPATSHLTYTTHARDLIGADYSLIDDEVLLPKRTIDMADFPGCPLGNVGLGVPIIGGAVVYPSSPSRGAIKLIDVGDFVCQDSVTRRCLLVCGHACVSVELSQNDIPIPASDYGVNAWAPGHPDWTDIVPSNDPWVEINGHWYTLVFVTGTRATTLDSGDHIYADVEGMDDAADGSGTLEDDLILLDRAVLERWGIGDYQSGASWPISPTFEFYPGGASTYLLDRDSWDDTSALAAITTTSPPTTLKGAFVIGAHGRRQSLRQVMAEMATSGNFLRAWHNDNQLMVAVLERDRTAFLGGRRTITDRRDILSEPKFNIQLRPDWLCNALDYQYARNYRDDGEGDYHSLGGHGNAQSVIYHGRQFRVEQFNYVRDMATADKVAQERLDLFADTPRLVTWTESLCGLEHQVLDGVALTHYSGIGPNGYDANGLWIIRQVVDPSRSTVTFTAIDVERLLSS